MDHPQCVRTSEINTIQTIFKNHSISNFFFLISKGNIRYLDRFIVLGSFSQASIFRTLLSLVGLQALRGHISRVSVSKLGTETGKWTSCSRKCPHIGQLLFSEISVWNHSLWLLRPHALTRNRVNVFRHLFFFK